MKIFFIIILSLLSIVVVAQLISSRSTKNTESHTYKVIKDYGSFEVRKYEPAIFSYVIMKPGSYRDNSGTGFRKLAGYIFGGNDKKQKIAMTTPVTMTMDDSVVMKFMVPKNLKLDDLPKPNDSTIQFEQEEAKTVAALRFGGWANDSIIDAKIQELEMLLKENDLTIKGKFSFLGYNPPYEVFNRRNEVIVEVEI